MRYLPHTPEDIEQMLGLIGKPTIESLFAHIPASLRTARPIDLAPLTNDTQGSDPLNPKAVMVLAEPVAAKSGISVETDEATGRRVVRNESGVIVGAASQRAEPKIVGFIPLANRARPQQVIITDASETEQRGRATVRKQREQRRVFQRKSKGRSFDQVGGGGHGRGRSPGASEAAPPDPGRREPAFVSLADFAPTFLELAGVPAQRPFAGGSLAPFLRGEAPAGWRDAIHTQCNGVELYYCQRSAMTTEHKYTCLLYTSPSPRHRTKYRMPPSA